MNEVRIKTGFGEVVVPYSKQEELEQGLADIGTVIKTVESKMGDVVPSEPRTPKPGFEDIYRFTPSGRVELLVATGRGETVALLLFAHGSDPVPPAQLEEESGVTKVVSNVLTTGAYKKYFLRLENGNYTLTPEGRSWVVDQIIPKIRAKTATHKK